MARTWIRWVLPWALLGSTARSALADGSIPSDAQLNELLAELLALVVLGIIVFVVLALAVRGLIRRRRKAAAAAAAAQVLPTARVVAARHALGSEPRRGTPAPRD